MKHSKLAHSLLTALFVLAAAPARAQESCGKLGALRLDLKVANIESDMIWDDKLKRTVRAVRYYNERFSEELPYAVDVTVAGKSNCKVDKALKFDLKVSAQKAKLIKADDGHGHGFKTAPLEEVVLNALAAKISLNAELKDLAFKNIPVFPVFDKLPEGQTFTSYTFSLTVTVDDGAPVQLVKRVIAAPIGD